MWCSLDDPRYRGLNGRGTELDRHIRGPGCRGLTPRGRNDHRRRNYGHRRYNWRRNNRNSPAACLRLAQLATGRILANRRWRGIHSYRARGCTEVEQVIHVTGWLMINHRKTSLRV
jgi:hypothetical protein